MNNGHTIDHAEGLGNGGQLGAWSQPNYPWDARLDWGQGIRGSGSLKSLENIKTGTHTFLALRVRSPGDTSSGKSTASQAETRHILLCWLSWQCREMENSPHFRGGNGSFERLGNLPKAGLQRQPAAWDLGNVINWCFFFPQAICKSILRKLHLPYRATTGVLAHLRWQFLPYLGASASPSHL